MKYPTYVRNFTEADNIRTELINGNIIIGELLPRRICSMINRSMLWRNTPQGYSFWRSIASTYHERKIISKEDYDEIFKIFGIKKPRELDEYL